MPKDDFQSTYSASDIDIKGERCVHAFIENASCRACADVCPKRAWNISDESVSLNTDLCDGCGLCVPVCSEGAISHKYEMATYEYNSKNVAFSVCEYSSVLPDKDIIPCLNSIGIRDLFIIYKKGITDLIVACGDCNQCPRNLDNNFFNTLFLLNKLLLQRGEKNFNCETVLSSSIPDIVKSFSKIEDKIISRRSFFSFGAKNILQVKNKLKGEKKDEEYTPVGELLPVKKADDMVLYSPHLDINKCVFCNACINICPHKALQIVDEEAASDYIFKQESCTGCKLCFDVCEKNAIEIKSWETKNIKKIELNSSKCTSCGAVFYSPKNVDKELCHICIEFNHNSKLFQILE